MQKRGRIDTLIISRHHLIEENEMKFRDKTPYTVVFEDYSEADGVGTRILFKDGDKGCHTEFMEDLDYNPAIVDWVLFGQYDPKWAFPEIQTQKKS